MWWTAFGAIAQAAGAVATFLAVVVSLRIATNQRKPMARGSAKLLLTFACDGSPGVYHIGFTVLNTGSVPIFVSSLGWRTGWLRWGPKALRHRYAVQSGYGDQGVTFPYDLSPNRSATTLSPLYLMKQAGMNEARAELFSRKLPLLGWAPVHGVIDVAGRRSIVVRAAKDLTDFLRTNEHGVNTDEQGLTNTAAQGEG